MKITHFSHAAIDKKKWDSCIENASNSLIYAYSFFLDAMSPGWDALIVNDYEIVMPLTWNKKFGIAYLRQPFFTQQLGIFGNNSFHENTTEEFIKEATNLFPFAEINLNYANDYKEAISKRSNLILSLDGSFYQIEKHFKNDLTKNIKEAKKNNLNYLETDDIQTAIESYKHTYSGKFNIPEEVYENFSALCLLLQKNRQLLIRKVNSKEEKMLAIGLFLFDKKRIYNIMSTTLVPGRKSGANHFLLYELIREFSGQNLILDFEGSEIPSINFFYKKFGAIEQPYPFVRINKLKPWHRLLKLLSDQYKSYNKK